MKKIEIYEPAMCCSTGLCGPGVDPELLRLSTLANSLSKKGATIKRYNLTSDPQEFVKNTVVNELLTKEGPGCLPLTLLDEQVVKTKLYPSEQEISQWLEIGIEKNDITDEDKGCCSDKNSCDIRCSPTYKGTSKDTGCC